MLAYDNQQFPVLSNHDSLYCQKVSPEMLQLLKDLREKVAIGFVGGSDLSKIKEQLGTDGTYLVQSLYIL